MEEAIVLTSVLFCAWIMLIELNCTHYASASPVTRVRHTMVKVSNPMHMHIVSNAYGETSYLQHQELTSVHTCTIDVFTPENSIVRYTFMCTCVC